jgi:hypothetical protein
VIDLVFSSRENHDTYIGGFKLWMQNIDLVNVFVKIMMKN